MSELDTSEVTSMFAMFQGCSKLTSLNIANFNTKNLESTRAMFGQCSSLKSIDLSGWNTSKVTDMGIMFADCSKLQRIFVGDSWTNVALTDNGKWATFSGCTNLAGVSDGGKKLPLTSDWGDTIKGDYAQINADSKPGYLTRAHTCIGGEVAEQPATCTQPGKTAGMACVKCGLEFSGFDTIPPTGHKFADGKCTACGVLAYGDCGKDCIWVFEPDNSTLVIKPAEGKECGELEWKEAYWHDAPHPWSAVDDFIETIKIEGRVIPTDCSSMFADLASLKKADLSGLDTGAATNSISVNAMFSGCGDLEEVVAPKLVSSKVNDMSQMFDECTSLKSVDVSQWDTQNVKSAWLMFWDCKYLGNLDVSGWDTHSMTNMGQMFHGCSSLTKLDVAGWDTSNVTSLDSIFRECSKLTTLDVSKWNTSKVEDMGSVFGECSALKAIDVSKWNTSSAKSMGGMFRNCSSLAELEFSESFDTSKVGIGENSDYLGYQSANADSAMAVDASSSQPALFSADDEEDDDAPQGVVEKIKYVGFTCMFYGCSKLTDLDLSHWKTSNAASMSNMFADCVSLNKIELPNEFDTSKVIDFRAMFMNCGGLSEVDAAKFDTSSARYIACMFAGCKDIEKLDVAGWDTTKVGAGDNSWWGGMSSLFADCAKLESLDLSKWDMNDVTDMADMFSGCSSLKDLKIAKVYADKIQASGGSLGGMFAGCESLESLDLSAWDVAPSSGGDAGKNYESLSARHGASVALQFDKSDGFGVPVLFAEGEDETASSEPFDYLYADRSESLSGMFKGCANLKAITLPDLSNFDSSDLSFMFAGCSNLESIDLSKLDTSGTLTMANMFNGCSKLKELDLSAFDTSSVTDMTDLFKGCSELERIMVGDTWNTSSLEDKTSELFAGCTALGGQNGTAYSDDNITALYAHIDTDGNPGYLTRVHEHNFIDAPEKAPTCVKAGAKAGVNAISAVLLSRAVS